MPSKCFISTGSKQVLHTLWQENIVEPDRTAPIEMQRGAYSLNYIKNLSKDEDTAVKEAKRYAKAMNIKYDGVWDSPRFNRAKHIEAYEIQFKHKRKKGKSFYYGVATPEFWDAWKKNKNQLKAEGFSVSKLQDRILSERYHEAVFTWYVFYRPEYKEA